MLVDCAVLEASANPAIRLTVAQLERQIADGLTNEQGYDGKALWLSGEISALDIANDGGVNLRLKSGAKFDVTCWMRPDDRKLARLLKLKVGDNVTFYGRCRMMIYATRAAALILSSAVPIKKD